MKLGSGLDFINKFNPKYLMQNYIFPKIIIREIRSNKCYCFCLNNIGNHLTFGQHLLGLSLYYEIQAQYGGKLVIWSFSHQLNR